MLVGSIIANPLLNGEVIRLDGALRMPPADAPPPLSQFRTYTFETGTVPTKLRGQSASFACRVTGRVATHGPSAGG